MNKLQQAQEQWYAGVLPEGVRFGLNSSVELLSGPSAGMAAAVISLEDLDPEPRYLVESSDGKDLYALQSQLRAI
jgi:hypothetical protein